MNLGVEMGKNHVKGMKEELAEIVALEVKDLKILFFLHMFSFNVSNCCLISLGNVWKFFQLGHGSCCSCILMANRPLGT